MGMGGSYNNNKGNGGNRVRPIGVMLLVAFGATLVGVMVVHKLRERRIFHLLVKEKDRDLVSLHLLLQKERDLGQEMKRKNEEMRGKILALTAHKAELDSRLSEMRSTIAFLKDEQRSVAMALEEKQNEIKMLREKEGDSQLAERLKQREAEIEDLRHRLQVPVTNPTANASVTKDQTEQDTESSQSASVIGNQIARDKESAVEGQGKNKAQAGGAFGGIVNVTETRSEVSEILQKTDGDSKIQDDSGNGSGSKAKGSRGKGRSRRMRRRLEKNGDAENDGARSARRLRSRRLYKDMPKIEMSKPQGQGSIVLNTTKESGSEDKKPEISEESARSKVEVHSPEAENQNPEETEQAKDQVARTDGELLVREEGETSKIWSPPQDGEASGEASPEKDAEEAKVGAGHEDGEDTDIADKKEDKTDAANDNFFREPRLNSDEDSVEYREETDESEF